MKSALIILGAGILILAVLLSIAFWLLEMLERAVASGADDAFMPGPSLGSQPGPATTAGRAHADSSHGADHD